MHVFWCIWGTIAGKYHARLPLIFPYGFKALATEHLRHPLGHAQIAVEAPAPQPLLQLIVIKAIVSAAKHHIVNVFVFFKGCQGGPNILF